MNTLTNGRLIHGLEDDQGEGDPLEEFVTSDGLTSEQRRAADDSASRTAEMVSRWMMDDPSALMSSLSATDVSSAAAHNLHFVRDVSYYDAIDEAMRKDPDIKPAFDLVVAMALRRGWELQPADPKNAKAIELRDIVEERVLGMPSRSFDFGYAAEMLPFGRLAHGFSVCETIYEHAAGRWEPQACIHCHPGKFSFDVMGELAFLDRQQGKFVEAMPGKFVSMQKGGMYGNPMGQSIVDQLQYVYMIKKAAYLAWVRYGENYGTPMAKGKLSADHDRNRTKELLNELKNMIRNINAAKGVVLRPEQELDFTDRGSSSSTTGGTVHERIIDRMTRLTYRIVFGSILHIMEAEFGTRAQADTHEKTAEIKVKPLGKSTSTAIQRDLINPYVAINEGQQFVELAPKFSIDTDEAIDIKNAIETLEAAQKLKIPSSRAQARAWLDLSAPEDDEDTIFIDTGTAGNDPKQDPPEDVETSEQENEDPAFEETDSERREKANRADLFLGRIAKAAAAESRQHLRDSFREYIGDLKRNTAIAGTLSESNSLFVFPSADIQPVASLALKAANLIAAADLFDAFQEFAPPDPEFADPPEDTPSAFADAVQWMLDREVMTVDEVRQIVSAVASMGFPADERELERLVRDEVLALGGTANPQVTQRIQSMVAAAVDQGIDAAEFFAGVDELIDAGLMPGGTDAYIDTVFRTETGNVYQRQQDLLLADPRIQDHYWGDQFFNPDDENSRDTHARMDGVKLKKGSAAWTASKPGPPWDFNCRCVRTAIIVGDIDATTEQETPGALGIVTAIERF